MDVVHIAVTLPDIKALKSLSQRVLGRNICQSLDVRGLDLNGLASYVAILGEFQKRGSDYLTTLRDPGSLLKHAHVSFLISADPALFYELAVDGEVDFLDCENERLVIVSGTLSKWRSTIIHYCSSRATHHQQQFASALLAQFDRIGLSLLWDNYTRSYKSGTLLLTEKR